MVTIENINLKNKLDTAKIYKIVDNSNDNIYIGSTCDSLAQRLSEHKYDYKRYLKGIFHNITSFEIIKNNDYKIELLEDCNIKTKQGLIERERYYVENNVCVNKYIPGRTQKEYNDINREKIKIYQNEKFECECGGKFTYANKARHLISIKHQKFIES